MPWWAWLLIAWAVVAAVVAFWLGAAAAIARRRERTLRARQLSEATKQDFRQAG